MIQLAQPTAVAVLCSAAVGVIVTVAALLRRAGVHSASRSMPGADAHMLRWRRRRLLGVGLGLICGTLLSGFEVWALGIDRGSPAAWLIVAVALLGSVIGLVVAGVPSARRKPTNSRVAHSRHLRFEDLVPSRLRWGARLMVILAVLVLIVTVALVANRQGSTQYWSARSPLLAFLLDPPVLMTVAALLGLIMFEVRGRSLAARSTTASNAAELSAEDLIRRSALSDLAWASILTGSLAVLFTGPLLLAMLGVTLPTPAAVSAFRIAVNFLGGIAVAMIVFRPARASRYVSGNRPAARSASS